jgi:hypothetical protein
MSLCLDWVSILDVSTSMLNLVHFLVIFQEDIHTRLDLGNVVMCGLPIERRQIINQSETWVHGCTTTGNGSFSMFH